MDDAQASRDGSRRRRWLASAGAAAAAALIGAASAAAQGSLTPGLPRPHLSLSGQEAIGASGPLAPGDTLNRTFAVRNDGSLPADVTLSRRIDNEQAGVGGALLSKRLQIRIVRRSDGKLLYTGSLAAMPALRAGLQGAHSTSTYAVRLRFPDGGPPASSSDGDNALQGAALELRLLWTAVPRR